MLSRLLRAYAAADPCVGYCQGMNFVAGLTLMYVPNEAEAFGVLHALLIGCGMRELYTPDMASLQVRPHALVDARQRPSSLLPSASPPSNLLPKPLGAD